MFMPRPQDAITVVRDDPQDTRKLPRIEAIALRNGHIWLQPNFGIATAALHMDMAWLLGQAFIRKEKVPQAVLAKDNWHFLPVSNGLHSLPHEHPVVPPHESHFMQVPFRTSVKFPHSPHASPS
jgi:hypothetical protein